MQESEKEQIDATREGSAARLAAIDAALKQEALAQLQAEDSYRSLQQQRVQTIRQMAEQELQARIQSIEAASKIDEQSIASQYRIAQMQLEARGATINDQERLELEHENNLYAVELNGLNRELQALEQSGQAKIAETQKTQQKIQALTQAHENQVAEIQARADTSRQQEFARTMVQMESSAARGFLSILRGHENFAAMMSGIAGSLTQSLIQAAIERMNHQESEKLSDAKTAAVHTYAEVSSWPIVGPVAAPALAAGAFAAVMAFNQGGIVPGVGRGDIVPAMLTTVKVLSPAASWTTFGRCRNPAASPKATQHTSTSTIGTEHDYGNVDAMRKPDFTRLKKSFLHRIDQLQDSVTHIPASDEAVAVIGEWFKADKEARANVRAWRTALLLAWLQHEAFISERSARDAVRLAEYQRQMHENYMPTPADNPWAAAQARIVKALKKGPMTRRDLHRAVHGSRLGTGIFGQALDGLL